MHTHIRTHIHTYTHIHTHIHTYIHTQTVLHAVTDELYPMKHNTKEGERDWSHLA